MADPRLKAAEPSVESDRKENQLGATSNTSETEPSLHNASIEADERRPLGREQEVLPRGHTFREWTHSIKAARLNQSDVDTARSTVPAKPSSSTIAPIPASPSTHLPQDLMTSGYYMSRSLHSPSSWKSLRLPNSSGQSSSGSLHTLAEHEGQEGDAYRPLQRAASTRVPKSPNTGRRHSKSASISQPVAGIASQPLASLRSQAADEPHPGFPNQALAALSPDPISSSRPQPQRSRSSYRVQSLLHNDIVNANRAQRERLAFPHVLRTADNSPIGSPGLFSPNAYLPSNTPEIDLQRAGSPQLHHLQVPKETHAAEIDHDMMTGNKMINSYEVIKELGRGEHGKVKLGRDNANDLYVAIKIVPRYSKHRRLGRLGEPQDQTKREIAILKKARHPNVVSLIEVIDDPSKNKVYLILEYVERGEIKWRKTGVREIAKINNTRFESECKGVSLTLEPSDHDRWIVRNAAMRHDALEQQRQRQPHYPSVRHYEWDEENDLERTLSHVPSASHSTHHSESHSASRGQSDDDYYALHPTHSLAGSMYGPYLDDFSYKPERKQSIAPSHMSSEYEFDREDLELGYVPALTQDEARRAFRDTLLGLEFLHAIGIIHRDIKPSNLLVASDHTVKISDFGVSYFGQPITDEEAEAKGRVTEKDAKPLDDERELARSVGTPAFWGPELCYEDPSVFPDGKAPKVTGAIDLWALGVTLYTMIYARLPFYATNELGLHAAVCTTDPVLPKTRLVPVDTTVDEHVTHTNYSINCNKRLDFELKFEAVPDSLRDLIRKLLTRDPAQRITIAQAKQHPWVLENIEDATQFLEPPKVVVQGGERRITEPDEKEIKEAVVKRSFFGEVARATRAFGNLFKGQSSGRKRGLSTGANTAASTSSESVNSPAGSTTSTVGKHERGREARRTSLPPPDELLNALHRSRENTGHPLAQSQTASPDNEELKNYFTANTPKQAYSPQASPRVKPTTHDARPKLPDRGLSSLSTADSVKTIRASQFNNAHHSTLEVPHEHESPHTLDTAFRAKMENLWEGTTRTFTRLASRDRRHGDMSRSPSVSRASSESEFRTMPSVAISHNQASGTLETPEALRHIDQTSDHETFSENLTDSSTTVGENCRQAPMSSPSAFLQAQEINQRRHILEAQQEAGPSVLTSETAETTGPSECPLSPDDVTHGRHPTHQSQAVPSPPQEADMLNGELVISTTVSSIEDFTNSSVTQSTSNPSFIATSGASSPPEEEPFLSNEYKTQYQTDPVAVTAPDFMRTEDTVVEYARPSASIATGNSPQQQSDDHNNEGDDEGSSDEDDMVMMVPKKIKT